MMGARAATAAAVAAWTMPEQSQTLTLYVLLQAAAAVLVPHPVLPVLAVRIRKGLRRNTDQRVFQPLHRRSPAVAEVGRCQPQAWRLAKDGVALTARIKSQEEEGEETEKGQQEMEPQVEGR